MEKVIAINHSQLKALIDEAIEKYGNECDLNFIDVSRVTDMHDLFTFSQFNGDISQWNVSKVIDMSAMFYESQFNGDISNWNVSHVEDMHDMFANSQFNGDISQWDVRNVWYMDTMFLNSKFNGDISNWDVSNVRDMKWMFYISDFSRDISNWLPTMKKNNINFEMLGLSAESKTLKLLRKRELMDQIRNENFRLTESALRSVKKLLNDNGYSVER